MTSDNVVVIAGTGQGGLQVAASLRQDGFEGRIVMVGEEPGLPYQRPPLSKTYLKEGDASRLLLRAPDFFETQSIELIEETRITSIDRKAKTVALSNGDTLGYDYLVLAVGTRNRKLPLEGAGLENVVEMRTLAHANDIRERIGGCRHVIVIGGGFIGLEFAAVARALGLEVTVLEAMPRLMGRVVSPAVSEFFLKAHRENGVEVKQGAMAARILDDGTGKVAGVELKDGRTIDGDMVLVAAGVVPNVEIAAEAGLEIDNGVVVDAIMLTSDPAISAIGDCASFIHARSGRRVRLESVQNAVDQAKCVAAHIVGRPAPYDVVPWFWSDQGPLKLQIAGLTDDADDVVVREPGPGRLSAYCFRKGELIGVETVNVPADHMMARRLLASGTPVTRAALEAVDFNLKAAAQPAA
ncbi:Rhodocoxin reductase [Hartmannibacter diazotrophicus]|uniref:Rhodocoxin reductase n=1 Tax=Hartmannibacter diazotrophicus TaxID=1482074 RepID=A0A2C9D249_9HYPH|nr:FAD-dependent oxidoreductase [Hartmannibacter diazotrophicus]SON54402.1 Rhodocoxin reductase [Hartmannibacter diazotrophicus]